jgi:hypothetical protein
VGNLVSYLRAKSESESVTPDTAFRFNSKDVLITKLFFPLGYAWFTFVNVSGIGIRSRG